MDDLFHCKPLASVLSRQACGARYERRIGNTCATCAVGRQHARGALPTQWPDGADLLLAAITPATMASLRIHLAVIESHVPAPMRGMRIDGATIREHSERAGLHPQVIRQRLLRGQSPEQAIEPRLRGLGRHPVVPVEWRRQTWTLRGFAKKVGRDPKTVWRWLRRGIGAAQIAEMCA